MRGAAHLWDRADGGQRQAKASEGAEGQVVEAYPHEVDLRDQHQHQQRLPSRAVLPYFAARDKPKEAVEEENNKEAATWRQLAWASACVDREGDHAIMLPTDVRARAGDGGEGQASLDMKRKT